MIAHMVNNLRALASCGFRSMFGAAVALSCLLGATSASAQVVAPVATNLVRFAQPSYTVFENQGAVIIQVQQLTTGTNRVAGQVDVIATDGTAINTVDYANGSQAVNFNRFLTVSFAVVDIIDNPNIDGNRTFTLRLQAPLSFNQEVALQITEPSTVTVTIVDDDAPLDQQYAGTIDILPGNSSAYRPWGGGLGFSEGIVPGAYWASQREGSLGPPVLNPWDSTPSGAYFTIARSAGFRGRVAVDYLVTTNNIAPLYSSLARPNFNFIARTGTVILDDFQMSTNILVPVLASGFLNSRPDTNEPFAPPLTVGLVITNARPVSEEVPYNVQPQIGLSQQSLALADITQGFAFVRFNSYITEGNRTIRIGVKRSRTDLFEENDQPFGAVSVHVAVVPEDPAYNNFQNLLNNSYALRPGSDYAHPYWDFLPPWLNPTTGETAQYTLSWADGEGDIRELVIQLQDDDISEFNEDIRLVLYKNPGETDGFVNPYGSTHILTIMDNDNPAGSADEDYMQHDSPGTTPPFLTTPGANNTVQAVLAEPSGKVIIGGDFSAVNTAPRIGLARLLPNGMLDTNFVVGTGISGFVRALARQPDGKILVGGNFDSYNGTPRFGIARLDTNGVVDVGFNPGIGVDGTLKTIAVQKDGRILIGGDFSRYDGTNVNYYARLLPNGKLDTSYNVGTGFNGPVNSIALTSGGFDIDRSAAGGPAEDRFAVDTGSSSGTITVDYDFLFIPDTLRIYHDGRRIYDSGFVNGTNTVTIPYNGSSTSIEVIMNEGSGLSGTVWFYKLRIEPTVDERPVIGGEFTEVDGVPFNFIARLNENGSVDQSFNPGTGADNAVRGVAKQGNKIIMVGEFTQVDLRSRRSIARLNEDGSLDTTFVTGTGFNNVAYSVGIDARGDAIVGGPFTSYNGTRRMGLARISRNGTIDTSFADMGYNQFAGITQPFSLDSQQGMEPFVASLAPFRGTNFIQVVQQIINTNDNTTNDVTVDVPVRFDRVFIGGRFDTVGAGTPRDQRVPRFNVASILGHATPGPGNIGFFDRSYETDENGRNKFITLVRTNGELGEISIGIQSRDNGVVGPGSALSGFDYVATNTFATYPSTWSVSRQVSGAMAGVSFGEHSYALNFGNFVVTPSTNAPVVTFWDTTANDVRLLILDDNLIEGDETFTLRTSAPDLGDLTLGGLKIPLGVGLWNDEASVTIVDNDFPYGTLGFTHTEYFVNENETEAVITLSRIGGAVGTVSVDVSTKDGTAGGLDYFSISRRTITFANGQTNAQISVRIKNDTIAELEEYLTLSLTNVSGFPANIPYEQRLDPNRSLARLNIIDDDYAPGRFSFRSGTHSFSESASEVVVGVKRNGGNLGEVFIDFETVNGTAIAGQHFVHTTGTLRWVDGDSAEKFVTVKLIDDMEVNPDRTFSVRLFNSRPVTDAVGSQPNTVVTLVNDDASGGFEFSQSEYSVDETGPYAIITVLRKNGMAGRVEVDFATTNFTAVGTSEFMTFAPNGIPDYVFTNNTLVFASGEVSKSFRVPIINDGIVEGDKIVRLVLSNPKVGSIISSNATLTIIDDELNRIPAGSIDTTFTSSGADNLIYSVARQADGKLVVGGDFTFLNQVARKRLARLNIDGTLDASFDPSAGPDQAVRAITLQSDGRMNIAGFFETINSTNRNRLARLNFDASVDTTFNPGAGTDNPIYASALQPDGKLIVVGSFSAYRGVPRKGVARINPDGTLDTTFNPGTGANAIVFSVAVQPDGKIIIGGDFTTYNEQTRNGVARLNANGSLDTTFGVSGGQPLAGADASVRSIALQTDGKILIGGLFSKVNGVGLNRLARLNQDGSLDSEFNPGTGADGAVNVIAVQIDGKIIAGGDFTKFNGRNRGRVTRLNTDGSLDPTINFGAGANGNVSSIIIQPDRRIVLAGGFTEYNGQSAQRIVRIHGGSIAGPGELRFSIPYYTVSEFATNAVLTIRRTGGTTGTVGVTVKSVGGTATPGVDYDAVSRVLTFPEAETFQQVLVAIRNDSLVEDDETVFFELSAPTGGAVLGSQPNAVLNIESDDATVEFSSASYSITENFVTGSASITVRRLGFTGSVVSVDFQTRDITATSGVDYQGATNNLVFAIGERAKTFSIPIFDDALVEGNEMFELLLSNISPTNAVLGLARSTVTIVDNDFSPGELSFTSDNYPASESSGSIRVTVRRTAGTTGVVSVDYRTAAGTASDQVDYFNVQGILSFSDGETEKSFTIPIIDDDVVEGNETILITISNPKGGAIITGPTTVLGTIVDDDLGAGSVDAGFAVGTGASHPVRTVEVLPDSTILIGGEFTSFNGVNRGRIAKLLSNGQLVGDFSPMAGGGVSDIEIAPNGDLLIGGSFNTVEGTIQNKVARLKGSGSLDTAFNLPLGLNAEVTRVALLADGKVLVAGLFDTASAAGRNRITRLDANGKIDISFNAGTGADAAVYALGVDSVGRILVGGAFQTFNGSQKRGLARLTADGAVDSSFNVGFGADGPVRDLRVLNDGRILIVGEFNNYNGVARSKVAILQANGSLDTTFNAVPPINGAVHATDVQPDGQILIAGDFTQIGSANRVRVARLATNGALDPSFDSGAGPDNLVHDIAFQPADGKVLIVGKFLTVDRQDRRGVARFNNDRKFIPTVPVRFQSVSRAAGGNTLQFVVETQPGFTYALQSTENLVGGGWITEQTIQAVSPTTLFTDEIDASKRFYRIQRIVQ